jgi:hypothetical protein
LRTIHRRRMGSQIASHVPLLDSQGRGGTDTARQFFLDFALWQLGARLALSDGKARSQAQTRPSVGNFLARGDSP